jgi:hypothetical protein
MPNLYATAEDCSSVAAHVQALTIPLAISPGLTECEADVNSEALEGLYVVYRFCTQVKATMNTEKNNPMPST